MSYADPKDPVLVDIIDVIDQGFNHIVLIYSGFHGHPKYVHVNNYVHTVLSWQKELHPLTPQTVVKRAVLLIGEAKNFKGEVRMS